MQYEFHLGNCQRAKEKKNQIQRRWRALQMMRLKVNCHSFPYGCAVVWSECCDACILFSIFNFTTFTLWYFSKAFAVSSASGYFALKKPAHTIIRCRNIEWHPFWAQVEMSQAIATVLLMLHLSFQLQCWPTTTSTLFAYK